MELDVFRRPAVAEELQNHFVEARLHTDGDAHKERILALQRELAKSVATPAYLIVEPEPEPKFELARIEGLSSEEQFLEFLRRGRAGIE